MQFRLAFTVAVASTVALACRCGGTGTGDGGADGACVPNCSGRVCGNDGCGNLTACGSCPGNLACNAAGVCVLPGQDAGPDAGEDPCGGPCPFGTICDTAQGICSNPCPGNTCQQGFICDTTKVPPSCKPLPITCGSDGGTCAVGQECTPSGCTCLPRRPNPVNPNQTLDDTCFKFGFLCNTSTGQCSIPAEMEWCVLPGNGFGGCQAGLDCVAVDRVLCRTGDTPRAVRRCAKKCTSNVDCTYPKAPFCFTQNDPNRPDLLNHCTWGPCDSPAPGFINPYAPCMAGTGFCVFEAEPVFECSANSYFARVPKCVTSGTAAPGADCEPQARLGDAGNPSAICPQREICVEVGDKTGFCGKGCIFGYGYDLGGPDGGDPAPCDTGTTCYNATGVYFIIDRGDGGTQVFLDGGRLTLQGGVCLTNCTVTSGPSDAGCSANASGRPFGCQVQLEDDFLGRGNVTEFVTGEGVCLPTTVNPPSQGGGCTSYDNAEYGPSPCADRHLCSDRLFASPDGGTCQQYCNLGACTAAPCASNCPANSNCGSVIARDGGVATGVCQ